MGKYMKLVCFCIMYCASTALAIAAVGDRDFCLLIPVASNKIIKVDFPREANPFTVHQLATNLIGLINNCVLDTEGHMYTTSTAMVPCPSTNYTGNIYASLDVNDSTNRFMELLFLDDEGEKQLRATNNYDKSWICKVGKMVNGEKIEGLTWNFYNTEYNAQRATSEDLNELGLPYYVFHMGTDVWERDAVNWTNVVQKTRRLELSRRTDIANIKVVNKIINSRLADATSNIKHLRTTACTRDRVEAVMKDVIRYAKNVVFFLDGHNILMEYSPQYGVCTYDSFITGYEIFSWIKQLARTDSTFVFIVTTCYAQRIIETFKKFNEQNPIKNKIIFVCGSQADEPQPFSGMYHGMEDITNSKCAWLDLDAKGYNGHEMYASAPLYQMMRTCENQKDYGNVAYTNCVAADAPVLLPHEQISYRAPELIKEKLVREKKYMEKQFKFYEKKRGTNYYQLVTHPVYETFNGFDATEPLFNFIE